MRLWHKDLIPVLPRKQLLSQWRECCALAKTIATKGTPNNLLVNKIMDYPLEKDFYNYCEMIISEMKSRGYKVNYKAANNYYTNMQRACNHNLVFYNPDYPIFVDWHNDRYLTQCYYNLQEKFDCGGISFEEWEKIENYMIKAMNL